MVQVSLNKSKQRNRLSRRSLSKGLDEDTQLIDEILDRYLK